jgi:hypothetical protein
MITSAEMTMNDRDPRGSFVTLHPLSLKMAVLAKDRENATKI